ncbi:MAG: c-type cytochrome [Ilumatobacteraceae bacterium]
MNAVGHSTFRHRLLLVVPAAVLSAAAVLAACGVNKDGTEALPGKALAEDYGCAACHSSDGSVRPGPTWKGLYQSQVELQDGTTVTADRNYLVESITDPAKQVRVGSPVQMPVNRVPDADVQKIVDYIISLQ